MARRVCAILVGQVIAVNISATLPPHVMDMVAVAPQVNASAILALVVKIANLSVVVLEHV